MIVRLAAAMLAGGFAAQHSRVLLTWDQCLPIIVALSALIFLRRLRLLVAFLVGILLFHIAASQIVDDRLDARYAGDSMLVVVRIVDFPKTNGATTSMIVAPLDDARLPLRSRVTWYEAPVEPRLGDTWLLELRLRRPRGRANPGGFDLERWLFREKLHASGYVVEGKRNRLLQSTVLGPTERIRLAVVRASRSAGSSQSVVAAVAVGARHDISREQWERYAKTGTSHLMAISGLHVGIAAAVAFVLSLAIGVQLRFATFAGVAVATAYTLVSGLGIPAQRATLMLALASLAVMTGRMMRPAHILMLCAAIVFVVDPVSTMAPGFGLSFGAVGVLFWASRSMHRGSSRIGRIRNLWSAQFYLLFGLLPLTVVFFDRAALLAPIVNFIVVPVFTIVTVPAALVGTALVAFELPFAGLCFRMAGLGVEVVEQVIELAARLPVADTRISKPSGAAFPVALMTLVWIVVPRGWPGRMLAPLALFCLLQPAITSPQRGCFDVHILDVGQGQAVVVQTSQSVLLYDTGAAYRSGGTAAESAIVSFVRDLGVREIDLLIVSHADLDHAGGVGVIRDEFPLGSALTGEPLNISGLRSFPCRSGQRWVQDDVEFTMIHPSRDYASDGNNRSCVLEIAAGNYRALLTGDIETHAEKRLVEQGTLNRVTLATVPHHGSLTSSGPAFVNRLAPAVAVSSTAFHNRWNFPSERVQRRWEGAGAEFFDTGASGAVSARLCRWRGLRRVQVARHRHRKFWHDDSAR